MSIPGAGNPLLLGGAGGYKIERSIRLNAPDTAYLRRTPVSTGNRRTWTWSGWVKRCEFGASLQQVLLGSMAVDGSTQTMIGFLYDNIDVFHYQSSTYYRSNSVSVIRDPSAWYHIIYAIDTTQASTSDRCKVYVNGVQVAMSAWTVPQNTDLRINAASLPCDIGTLDAGNYYKFNGYLADVHFIDGQALTPSGFGETDINGIWQPKAYSGSYGTNGFKLAFADNSAATATTLGKDTSPNGNNFTPTNFSVTAGAGNDSLVDTPTNYGSDTGAGNEVRGNYATLNPLIRGASTTLSNGNLDVAFSGWNSSFGTVLIPTSGKWFFEVNVATTEPLIGIARATENLLSAAATYFSNPVTSYSYYATGAKALGPVNTQSTYGAAYTSGDVVGVAFDADAGTIVFYKNGVSQGTAFTGITGQYVAAIGASGGSFSINFGQRQWAYAPPAGFKALCTQNLPAPTITKPSTVMDVKLYTGNGSTQTISGLRFSPDLVWIKGRSGATDHALYDSVRGATLDLVSNSNAAETTQTQGLTAFNSDGFSLDTLAKVNTNTATYAGWAFDAGSSTVTNTQGSITSQVRANASAGFSVVSWTSPSNPSTGWTVGHGLGVAPSLIITKQRGNVSGWYVYHSTLGGTNFLQLNGTNASTANSNIWNNTAPTSTVVSFGGSNAAGYYNASTTQITYCFAPVAGYSAFGSYTGNGNGDGPFVYLGFRPAFLMIKGTSGLASWVVLDYQRLGYNADNNALLANLTNAEDTTDIVDIVSNGFKIRINALTVNNNLSSYIYIAFAESPFQYARAR